MADRNIATWPRKAQLNFQSTSDSDQPPRHRFHPIPNPSKRTSPRGWQEHGDRVGYAFSVYTSTLIKDEWPHDESRFLSPAGCSADVQTGRARSGIEEACAFDGAGQTANCRTSGSRQIFEGSRTWGAPAEQIGPPREIASTYISIHSWKSFNFPPVRFALKFTFCEGLQCEPFRPLIASLPSPRR